MSLFRLGYLLLCVSKEREMLHARFCPFISLDCILFFLSLEYPQLFFLNLLYALLMPFPLSTKSHPTGKKIKGGHYKTLSRLNNIRKLKQ